MLSKEMDPFWVVARRVVPELPEFDLEKAKKQVRRNAYVGIVRYRPPTHEELTAMRTDPNLTEAQRREQYKPISDKEFRATVHTMVGVPILFGHLDNVRAKIWGEMIMKNFQRMPLGLVTRAWLDRFDTVHVEFRPFDNYLGYAMVWMIDLGIYGLSIQHAHNFRIPQYREISLCAVGKCDYTAIETIFVSSVDRPPLDLGLCIDYQHPPPLPITDTLLQSLFCSFRTSAMATDLVVKPTATPPVVPVANASAVSRLDVHRFLVEESSKQTNPDHKLQLSTTADLIVGQASANGGTDADKAFDFLEQSYAKHGENAVTKEMLPHIQTIWSTLEVTRASNLEKEKLLNKTNAAAFDSVMSSIAEMAATSTGMAPPPVVELCSGGGSLVSKSEVVKLFQPFAAAWRLASTPAEQQAAPKKNAFGLRRNALPASDVAVVTETSSATTTPAVVDPKKPEPLGIMSLKKRKAAGE